METRDDDDGRAERWWGEDPLQPSQFSGDLHTTVAPPDEQWMKRLSDSGQLVLPPQENREADNAWRLADALRRQYDWPQPVARAPYGPPNESTDPPWEFPQEHPIPNDDLATDPYLRVLTALREMDVRTTGRCWPQPLGASALGAHAEDADDLALWRRLGLGLGMTDGVRLAQNIARHYVEASRLLGERDLVPVDLYGIAHFGLGFNVRPLDCRNHLDMLAMLLPETREIYIDESFLPPVLCQHAPPAASATRMELCLEARYLLAWLTAHCLTMTWLLPIPLRFIPYVPGELYEVSFDQANRHRLVTAAFRELIAPLPVLAAQLRELGLRSVTQNWRSALYQLFGQTHQNQDTVQLVIATLSAYNGCPPLLIESQLDGPAGYRQIPWPQWSERIIMESVGFGLRAQQAHRYFERKGAYLSPTAPLVRPGLRGESTWKHNTGEHRQALPAQPPAPIPPNAHLSYQTAPASGVLLAV